MATKDEVLKQLGSVALVHIAVHGDMEAGEILLDPNIAGTAITRKENDCMLRMSDVQAVQLRARLVVLKEGLHLRVWSILAGLSWELVLVLCWCHSGQLMTKPL